MKGYNQKPSFNYKETFSPIVMLKSIKILLSIAAHLDYKIWQMDVKTTFLNELLKEDNNMIQLYARKHGDPCGPCIFHDEFPLNWQDLLLTKVKN